MPTTATPTKDADLYLCDNGACYCGKHLGMTARFTGRDLSGQPIAHVDADTRSQATDMGITLRCETCGTEGGAA